MTCRYSIFMRMATGLALLICGCQNSDSQDKITPNVSKLVEPPAVRVVAVKRGDLSVPIFSTGTVFPELESKVGPKISGTIEMVQVDEGDQVAGGEILARLDQKDLLIAVRQGKAAVIVAEAQLREAELKEKNLRRERQRLANLLGKNVISQQRYDDIDTAHSMAVSGIEVIRAQILTARENLAMAEQKLRDTVILAPFSGLIVKRYINRGEFVSTMPPSPLFLIMNIDRVKTEVDLPEVHLARVAIGNPVEITVDTYPGSAFKGKISTINPMVDPVSRAFRVKIEIPNRDHRLRSGMFARVIIHPEIHKDALIVPFKAVMHRGGDTVAFTVEGDTVRLRAVKVGIDNEREIEVIDGLHEGEEVVVEGHYGMEDNTRVRVLRD